MNWKRLLTGIGGAVASVLGAYFDVPELKLLGAAVGGVAIPWPDDVKLRRAVAELLRQLDPAEVTPPQGPRAEDVRVRRARETLDTVRKLLNGSAPK